MDQLRVMSMSQRLSAAPRALAIFVLDDPGVRCASPRALCCRPLRGLRTSIQHLAGRYHHPSGAAPLGTPSAPGSDVESFL